VLAGLARIDLRLPLRPNGMAMTPHASEITEEKPAVNSSSASEVIPSTSEATASPLPGSPGVGVPGVGAPPGAPGG
jgi:hypothetical protein